MPLISYNGTYPEIENDVFIAYNACIIGNVKIGAGSSIWYNSVLRGDVNKIVIGERTNIQDGSIIHVSSAPGGDTTIGDDVTVGHLALIHACNILSKAFIGMGATIMDEVLIEEYGLVGAGSLITRGKRIGSSELWKGVPGAFSRRLREDERSDIILSSQKYVTLAKAYLQNQKSDSDT